MSRIEAAYKEKWTEISNKPYADQAKFFLNGFWDELQGEAENIYKLWQKVIVQDADKKKEGEDLDEFEAHKFLESLGETLTVIALREKLRKIDLDNNNRMSLLEYLVFKYNKTVKQVVESPQGDNREALAEAQSRLDAAQAALEEVQARLEAQKQALAEQKKAEQLALAAKNEAAEAEKEALAAEKAARQAEKEALVAEEELRKAEEEVRKTEEAAKAAEAEVKKTVDELKKQEDDFKNKCADLEKKTKEGTLVQKNKAVQELAALKSEDPLPLRKAKISAESALRKAEKSRKEAEAATNAAAQKTAEAKAKTDQAAAKTKEAARTAAAAKASREEAERTLAASQQARLEAEEATRQVEIATQDAVNKFQEAQDYLEEVRNQPGQPFGILWWIERDITEAKKYLPKHKQ